MALPASPNALDLRTYDDLLAMPEDGNRYELIFGEIVMSAAPKTKHQRALMALSLTLGNYVMTHRLGELFAAPLDVKFSIYSVVQPDLLFVARARAHIVTEHFIDGAPDLVIEILSPSNRAQDLVKKAALYAQHGVTEYWIVDPESETISINLLRGGQYVDVSNRGGVAQSTVLPGLGVPTADIFSVPDWLKPTERDTT